MTDRPDDNGQHDVDARPGDADADTPNPGASAPEPSLAARIDRSIVRDRAEAAGRQAFPRSEVGADESAGNDLTEGLSPSPGVGRVDAADATLGRHAGEVGSFASGEGQSSVGGVQGDRPRDAVADQPLNDDSLEGRAGFLEGQGGRRGVAASQGELYDDMGGDVRSAADAARDSADASRGASGGGH